MKKLITILIAVVLTGCATQPVSTRDAAIITGNQLLEKKYSQKSKNSGRVIVKRDSGFVGMACSVRVFVNGHPMADLDTEEKVIFYLPPNEYIIGVQPNGICGGGLVETDANVKVGKQLTYRVGSTLHGGIFISRTAI